MIELSSHDSSHFGNYQGLQSLGDTKSRFDVKVILMSMSFLGPIQTSVAVFGKASASSIAGYYKRPRASFTSQDLDVLSWPMNFPIKLPEGHINIESIFQRLKQIH